MTELSKEQSDITDAYESYQKYKQLINAIDDANSMINDPELAEIARSELISLEKKRRVRIRN